MFAKPQDEHHWLAPLAGEWTFESECVPAPDQPPMKSQGRVRGRSLGGLWIQLDMEGTSPEGEPWISVMTLGFDPAQGKFLGTFVASVMTHQWIYSGTVDRVQGVLTLDTTGPQFDKPGMTDYQDIVTIVDSDTWILTSRMRGEDGQWTHFMTQKHRRVR